jgi:hypothetical protein
MVAAGAAIAGTVAGMAASYYFFSGGDRRKVKDTPLPAKRSLPLATPVPSILNESTSTILFPHNHEEKMRRRIEMREVEEENSAPRNSVTVRVPATSANMGPGCTFLLSE